MCRPTELRAAAAGKNRKIVLYDDEHAASAWESLSKYIDLPIEYTLIHRLKDNKSLADIKLAAGTCKEFYLNKTDSFVLVSSDSDYWGLIESIPEARFLVMVEHRKCSPAMKSALDKSGIFYCFIDDFYAGDGSEIKKDALLKAYAKGLRAALDANMNDILSDALSVTRIAMSYDEKEAFLSHYVKNRILVETDPSGHLRLSLKIG